MTTKAMKQKNKPIPQQQGIALVMALIMLVVMTLLVITSMRTALLEERMTGHARDHDLGFQSGESVLRTAGENLTGQSLMAFNDTCNQGLCSNGTAPSYDTYDWINGNKHITLPRTNLDSTISTAIASDPRYMIEHAGQIKSNRCSGGWCPVYRITTRATGNSSSTIVYLQEIYR